MLFFKFHDFARSSVGKRDLVILVNFIVALLMNIAIWVILLANFSTATEYIIIRYNIYFGISALGPWYALLATGGIGLGVIILNFVLALGLYLNYKILSYFLVYSATILNLILLVAGILLIYNNF